MRAARNIPIHLVLFVLPLFPVLGCGKEASTNDETTASGHSHSGKRSTDNSDGEHDHAAAGHTPAGDPSQTPTVAPFNAKCPITGDPIDPELTVDYKGKRVGLCCKDCIAEWDKLSDALKDAKLRQ